MTPAKPRVEVHYCPACHWLPRSTWMAQEILYTFGEELGEVALVPASESGRFTILLDGEIIWDRRQEGGFPDVKTLKRKLRDAIAPDRALGHLDK